MRNESIEKNFQKIRRELPDDVKLLLATKGRSAEEVSRAIDAGARLIGENYTSPEAVEKYEQLGDKARWVQWHLIGHLQTNDINKALPLFDMIQTVESVRKGRHIDKRVERAGKEVMPVLIEVNSAEEENKYGVPPRFEALAELLRGLSELDHLAVRGLMTMGPFREDPEEIRPFFRKTKELFERAKELDLPNCRMEELSMGMSDSYRVAVEEGATIVRPGTAIFGPRE